MDRNLELYNNITSWYRSRCQQGNFTVILNSVSNLSTMSCWKSDGFCVSHWHFFQSRDSRTNYNIRSHSVPFDSWKLNYPSPLIWRILFVKLIGKKVVVLCYKQVNRSWHLVPSLLPLIENDWLRFPSTHRVYSWDHSCFKRTINRIGVKMNLHRHFIKYKSISTIELIMSYEVHNSGSWWYTAIAIAPSIAFWESFRSFCSTNFWCIFPSNNDSYEAFFFFKAKLLGSFISQLPCNIQVKFHRIYHVTCIHTNMKIYT